MASRGATAIRLNVKELLMRKTLRWRPKHIPLLRAGPLELGHLVIDKPPVLATIHAVNRFSGSLCVLWLPEMCRHWYVAPPRSCTRSSYESKPCSLPATGRLDDAW